MENAGNSGVGMDGSEITFDNLIILKEFGNIVNLVRNEDFLETVPKGKIRRVKWVPMFNCLKQGIFDEMVQELSSMWEYENMPEKLEQLEKLKEKYSEVNEDQILWRPQLNDVKSQLKASDVANIKKQKVHLESLVKEYETRVNRLKKIVSAKRGFLKALQLDIQKYQKKNDECISKISDKFEEQKQIIRLISPVKVDVDKFYWMESDVDQ